jgi:hypothetical protein
MKHNRGANKAPGMKSLPASRPEHHTRKIKDRMRRLIEHLRSDVGKITEPKAQALFETSAEVLTGLVKAFGDYEKKNEKAWRAASAAPRRKSQAL